MYRQLRLSRHSAGHQKSVLIREVSLYPKSHYVLIQLEGTLLWAWKCCRYWRIVVISAVVISELSLYPQSSLAKLTVQAHVRVAFRLNHARGGKGGD